MQMLVGTVTWCGRDVEEGRGRALAEVDVCGVALLIALCVRAGADTPEESRPEDDGREHGSGDGRNDGRVCAAHG